jgi:ssDNA-binding Zn-finger/Zn-ribbon topoisomerase 1
MINLTCPKCNEGKITGKRTKKGKTFYGCNRFPKCDFALWDKPLNEFQIPVQWHLKQIPDAEILLKNAIWEQ